MQIQGHIINERRVYLSLAQRQEAKGWLEDIGISTKGDSIKRILHLVDGLYDGGLDAFAVATECL